MIAKKTYLIFRGLTESSLQSSLQKLQLSRCLNFGFRLQFSLQPQAGLQTVCKENKAGLQYFIKIPFANPFAETQT
jgi:hypothetical protein